MGAQFAEKYPKIASRLRLESSKETEDPHVERLIESFAFLAARVHLRLDDDFPEITEALLNIVYPHFVRPIPSMSSTENLPPVLRSNAIPLCIRGRSRGPHASSVRATTPLCGLYR